MENIAKKNEDINISELIDTLLSVRLSLSVKRVNSPTINRLELKKIINDATNNKDLSIKNALDDIFDEYLGKKDKKESEKYTLDDIERIINENIKYVEEKQQPKKELVHLNNDKVA